jgi:hypothetical protein
MNPTIRSPLARSIPHAPSSAGPFADLAVPLVPTRTVLLDASPDAADPVAPAYGGPPDPPDAGNPPDAAGGVAPLYGGSPGS